MKPHDILDDSPRRAAAELRFIDGIRRALEESATALPEATLQRLALARKTALRAQLLPQRRRVPVGRFALAGGHSFDGDQRPGFARTGMVWSAIVLVGACLAGLYQFEQDRRIQELADMDTAVLNDDLPISAYADQGFNAFIKQNP